MICRTLLMCSLVLSAVSCPRPLDASEIRAYAYLTPAFLGPVLDAFEAETGIRVDTEYMRAADLRKRLAVEGNNPGADIVFTMEAKRLASLVEDDALTAVKSTALETAIPARFRHPDGLWFGLSKWSRTVFHSTERVDPSGIRQYADLASPRWKGRICVRPSNKIYVQSLLAAMIANHGESETRAFVRGLVENLARPPVDLDLVQLRGIVEGVCDLAIANTYYFARLRPAPRGVASESVSNVQRILDTVAVHYPDADGPGVHMNVSGFAMTRADRRRADVVKLMEYLVRPAAQRLYADASMDRPVVSGLRPHARLLGLGEFREDPLPAHALAEHYELAERISREEGWTWE